MNDIKEKEPNILLLGVCKTPKEQGKFEKESTKKIQILKDFLNSGGDFIDLDVHNNELKTLKQFEGSKLWLSCHDFNRVPENIEEIYKLMNMFQPYGVKFALTPRTPLELKDFLDFAAANTPKISYYNTVKKPEIIVTTMGEKYGLLGRNEIEEKKLSWGGFYALSENHTTANGQKILAET